MDAISKKRTRQYLVAESDQVFKKIKTSDVDQATLQDCEQLAIPTTDPLVPQQIILQGQGDYIIHIPGTSLSQEQFLECWSTLTMYRTDEDRFSKMNAALHQINSKIKPIL